MNFSILKTAVQKQFLKMIDKPLFRVAIDGDLLWKTYLEAFPAGSDPFLRKRTEHDCSCCRHFIKTAGKIVTVENGKLVSLWDIDVTEPAYQVVANALARLVRARPIEEIFLSAESTVGTDKNFETILGGGAQTYTHFFLRLPASAIVPKGKIGEQEGIAKSAYDVFLRALTEIGLEEVDTVLELIAQNSLYRGEEHKAVLEQFRDRKVEFRKVPQNRFAFVWSVLSSTMPAVAHIRNSSIGSLLIDLAEGKELDVAVKAFEAKVAPANYKRPTALVTKAMIEKAKKTVEELGLTSALERRYAVLEDVSICDLLFADRSVRKKLTGNVFEELVPTKPSTHKMDKLEEIGIEEFLSEVVPKATSLEVLVENQHLSHLVSLIAPCDLTAKRLFKWDNLFSWSYAGDFADSIKERVKRAGGKVDGDLRCSLSWNNGDDLDLHMIEPSREEICFYYRRSRADGNLDVDMNAGGVHSRTPVENICYPARGRMTNGIYTLAVHQYTQRETTDVGFEVEIEFDGVTRTFAHPRALRQGETVTVAKIQYKNGKFEIIESIPSTQVSKEAWGIRTQEFVPVTAVMLSPNYWGGKGVGNKHYFFMLKGCVRDGVARGFYNEFLTSELDQHRKVLEMVGTRMKTQESAEQMSGLGFSSTQKTHVMVRVKGSFTRTLQVNF